MKRIIVTFAGGRLALGYSRALKCAPEPVYLIGLDSHKVQLHRAVTDEKHLIPRAKEPDFVQVLRSIIEDSNADLLWVNHEAEIAAVSRLADDLGIRTFLPPHETIALCQDKMASYQRFKEAGVAVPESMPIYSEADVDQAFRQMGNDLWVRAIAGAGGKGSLPVSDPEVAKKWIDLNKGWGRFMAARRLADQSLTWESIWDHGRLIAAQGRKRLYWEFSSLTMSGITGIGGAHLWVSDPELDRTALQAIRAVDPVPHGLFSVDMTQDQQGMLMVTEINCGRFMSGGLISYTNPPYNLPYIATQLALGERPNIEPPLLNPLSTDLVLIHGMDTEPALMSVKEIDRYSEELERRKQRLGQGNTFAEAGGSRV